MNRYKLEKTANRIVTTIAKSVLSHAFHQISITTVLMIVLQLIYNACELVHVSLWVTVPSAALAQVFRVIPFVKMTMISIPRRKLSSNNHFSDRKYE